MCGIAGFSLNPTDDVDATLLASALLTEIERRGRDAAGAAWTDPNGDVWVQKQEGTATDFIGSLDLSDAQAVILHTRWATQGDPKNNSNNHPIEVNGIVGVHNGRVDNDRSLFTTLGVPRTAQVDSEAIFALLAHGPEVFGTDRPHELLTLVQGRAAVAWLEPGNPRFTLRVARVRFSPLAIGRTRGGSFLFASTLKMLRTAARKAGVRLVSSRWVGEGMYFRVQSGRIVAVRAFTPAEGFSEDDTEWQKINYARPSRFELRDQPPAPRRADHPVSRPNIPRQDTFTYRPRWDDPADRNPFPKGPWNPYTTGNVSTTRKVTLIAGLVASDTGRKVLFDTTRHGWVLERDGSLTFVGHIPDNVWDDGFSAAPGEVYETGLYAGARRLTNAEIPNGLVVPRHVRPGHRVNPDHTITTPTQNRLFI